MKIKVLITTIAAVAVLLGAGLLYSTSSSSAPQATFVLLDGSLRTADDFRGKVTLVNFWATSCTTCVAEMPTIVRAYEKYRSRGYETVAVAMSYDPPTYVVNFASTRKLPFAVALDNTGAVAKAWGDVKVTPTTFVVNKRGNIVKRYVGKPNFDELDKLIEELLSET
ncbi:peroxiredoxin family protein [Polaromonas sp.]|uniref:peroxiredoxin family protein n=1 Tax=Polaromonas sp. TaxID=1869339 RepID=UPI00352AA41A